MPPACCRVVPSAENTVIGAGLMAESLAAHVVVSESMSAWSLAPVDLGARREIVCTPTTPSLARSVERMCEPTRPVDPMTAAVDIVAGM